MNRIAFIGLIKIEFPTRTVRLCDGGFIVWGAETFRSQDDVFGVVGGMEPLSDGVDEAVPVYEMTILPPSDTPVGDLSQPGFQTSRVRLWLAEYDVDTGLLDGTPDLRFDGQIDQTIMTFGPASRDLSLSVVSNATRFLERNIGNSLNPTWHKSIWPGETGHDNANGLGRQIAWGVEAPA